jgi:hypothetical protein
LALTCTKKPFKTRKELPGLGQDRGFRRAANSLARTGLVTVAIALSMVVPVALTKAAEPTKLQKPAGEEEKTAPRIDESLPATNESPANKAEANEPQQQLEQSQEPHAPRAVVFTILRETDPAILGLIRDALQAQLSDIPVRLVFTGGSQESAELRNLIDKGKSIAKSEDAVGVFWLDANQREDWLLYLVDPDGERVLVRRAGPGLESLAATVEAVAVITRSSSIALLEGQAEDNPQEKESGAGESEWQEIKPQAQTELEKNKAEKEEEIEKQKPVASQQSNEPSRGAKKNEESLSESSRARLALAYRGTTFARQYEWQSGISIWAGWITEFRIYFGLGYFWIPETTITTQLKSYNASAEFSVERYPVETFIGYQYCIGDFAFEGELGAIIDIIARQAKAPADQAGFTRTDDQTGVDVGVLARGRVEYFLQRHITLFLGLSFEYFLRNFDYVAKFEQSETLLRPNPARFSLEIGLAFYL